MDIKMAKKLKLGKPDTIENIKLRGEELKKKIRKMEKNSKVKRETLMLEFTI